MPSRSDEKPYRRCACRRQSLRTHAQYPPADCRSPRKRRLHRIDSGLAAARNAVGTLCGPHPDRSGQVDIGIGDLPVQRGHCPHLVQKHRAELCRPRSATSAPVSRRRRASAAPDKCSSPGRLFGRAPVADRPRIIEQSATGSIGVKSRCANHPCRRLADAVREVCSRAQPVDLTARWSGRCAADRV